MSNRAAVYARFSDDKQNEASITEQIKAAQAFAGKQGLEIVKKYKDEAKTGTNDSRPGFQRMMADARKQLFDFVIIWNTNRLHRNMFNAFSTMGELLEHDIKILSVTQPEINNNNDDITLLIMSIHSWKDMKYSRDLSNDVKRGMSEKAAECRYIGYKVYGYDHSKQNKFIVNKQEAAIVQECFTLYLQGSTIREIAETLNRRGLRTPRDNKFSYNFIERMLKRESYIGRYYYNGELISEHGYPQIIDTETFCQAQDKLTRKRGKSMNTDFLLTSKLFCGICEKPLRGISGNGKRGTMYHYYACGDKWTSCATGKALPKDWLESEVVGAIREAFSSKEKTSRIVNHLVSVQEQTAMKPEVEIARERLEEIQRQQKKLLKAYLVFEDTALVEEEMKELEVKKLETELEIRRFGSREELLLEEDFYEFFEELSAGDLEDKFIINRFITKVVLYEDRMAIVTNMSGVDPSLAELTRVINEKTPDQEGCSSQIQMVGDEGFEPPTLSV